MLYEVITSVDIAKVRSESDRYQKSLGEMRAKVGKILDELAGRKVYGAIAVGLLIIAGFILLLMRKTYEEEEYRITSYNVCYTKLLRRRRLRCSDSEQRSWSLFWSWFW